MREATIHLSSEQLKALGIEEFVTLVREAGLEQVSELQCGRPGCLLVIEVAEPITGKKFSSIPNLEWWEEVISSGTAVYLCKLAVPALQDDIDPRHEVDTSQQELGVTPDGITITLVGEQEALAGRVDQFHATGANPVLRTLTDYEGPHDLLDALTARQREVLTLAFEMGYFDIPREVTTDDIATELGIDSSTVREHLQRAQKNLLAGVLHPA